MDVTINVPYQPYLHVENKSQDFWNKISLLLKDLETNKNANISEYTFYQPSLY